MDGLSSETLVGIWCRTNSPLQRLGLIVYTPRWMKGVYLKRALVQKQVTGCLTHPGINLGPITLGPLRLEAGSSPLPETTRHIIQVCPRTSGPRIQRHDRVVRFLSAAAERAGYKVMVEPKIVGHTLGVRKPDLLLWNESKAYVADVTITSDQVEGFRAHCDKVAYYDQLEISEWVQNIIRLTGVSFSAVAANWRVSCRLSVQAS